jgi:hypothetical protein
MGLGVVSAAGLEAVPLQPPTRTPNSLIQSHHPKAFVHLRSVGDMTGRGSGSGTGCA